MVALLLTLTLEPRIQPDLFTFFYLAVLISTLHWGSGSAIAAIVLSVLLNFYCLLVFCQTYRRVR